MTFRCIWLKIVALKPVEPVPTPKLANFELYSDRTETSHINLYSNGEDLIWNLREDCIIYLTNHQKKNQF